MRWQVMTDWGLLVIGAEILCCGCTSLSLLDGPRCQILLQVEHFRYFVFSFIQWELTLCWHFVCFFYINNIKMSHCPLVKVSPLTPLLCCYHLHCRMDHFYNFVQCPQTSKQAFNLCINWSSNVDIQNNILNVYLMVFYSWRVHLKVSSSPNSYGKLTFFSLWNLSC